MRVEEQIRLAQAYLTQGKRREAIAACQDIIQQQPEAATVYKILGEALEGEGATEAARHAYLKAIALQPNFVEVHASLGQLYSQEEEFEEATFHYQQALALRPNQPELHYNLGNVFHRQGNLSAAIRSYRQAIALKPDYVSAYFNLGVTLDGQGLFEGAIESYQTAIALQPDYVEAYSNLGSVLVKQGKVEEAQDIYQQAIAIAPNSASLYNNLGQLLSEKPDRAIAAYRRAIELEPEMLLAHYNLGKVWQFQGNFEAAIACFEQAIALNPRYIPGYADCGSCLMALGKFAKAMFYFQEAIALQPAFIEAYCHHLNLRLMGSAREKDEIKQARAACGRLLGTLLARKLTTDNLSSERNQLAIAELCENLVEIYLHLGNALVEYGGYLQAESYYHKALQIHPNDVNLYELLGNCLAKQRRYNAALIIYNFAINLQPHRPEIKFELGKVLEKQQRWEQAIAYYQKVLAWQLESGKKSGNFQGTLSCPLPLPKGIYLSSWDWMVANQLDPGNYAEIIWEKLDRTIVPTEDNFPPPAECGGLSCGPCLNRIARWFKPVHLGFGIHIWSQKEAIPVEHPRTFVATVPNGRVWIFPQTSDWLLSKAIAVITPDNYLLADVSRDYPAFLPGCQKHDPVKHSVFQLESFPPLEKVDGTVAVLSGLSGNVYFHWMMDVLPRIEILRKRGIDFNKIDWFLVNSYQHKFQRETLEVLGIPEAKILESDRHPHIQAKELICPSFPGYLGWPPFWAIDFLRRELLTGIYHKTSYPERIYISRNKARYRRVLNEEEVIEELSQYGFVSILPETMSLQEQIAYFFHAKVIVAAHGSGLTNIVFCRPGTQVIELVSPNYVGHYYWGIGHYLKLEHYYLAGEPFECYPIRQLMYQNSLTEDMWIDLSALKKMMEVAKLKG